MGASALKSYHHGDLRNALIVAGAELIEESGSLNFTMADAARRAGVSTAAPYRHFRDRDDLLDAVAQLAFFGLSCAAAEASTQTERGSIDRILAIGNAYMRYVMHKAAFYDLMWGDIGTRSVDDESFDKKASGFSMLMDAVDAYLQAESITQAQVIDISVKLWSMVHGLSSIQMGGKLAHFHPDADVYAMMESATRTFVEGLKSQS